MKKYLRAGSKVTAKPFECIDSVTTMPLNRSGGMGWRTRMCVLYGCPFAVPEAKYSSVASPKSAGVVPGASGRRPGYMSPPSVIGPWKAGIGGTACANAVAALASNSAAIACLVVVIVIPVVIIVIVILVALALGRDAHVARSLADVSRAAVAQRLRIGAQRPAAAGVAEAGVWANSRRIAVAGGDDLVGRDAVLDPIHHRRQHVEVVGGDIAAAVAHVRDEIELHEVIGVLDAAVLARHVAEVLERVRPGRTGIGKPVIEDQLAAVLEVGPDVGGVVDRW